VEKSVAASCGEVGSGGGKKDVAMGPLKDTIRCFQRDGEMKAMIQTSQQVEMLSSSIESAVVVVIITVV
jgi:hypothetical protein